MRVDPKARMFTPTQAPDDVPDKHEVPQNDPNARAGWTFDPYADPCQKGFYRRAHITENGFGDGTRATSLVTLPQCPPLWIDEKTTYDIAVKAGFAFAQVSGTDAESTLPIEIRTNIIIDPTLGKVTDPWNKPSDLQNLPQDVYLKQKYGVEIPLHTNRQVQVATLAAKYGALAKSVQEIPPCPAMFSDVKHYWDMVSVAAFEATHRSGVRKIADKVLYIVLTSAGKIDWWNIAALAVSAIGGSQVLPKIMGALGIGG